ncbi:MAG: galactokinase [Verrucomicrobiales bacterium]|nr:galactokinase [Verrucomicrobiales bacterium]
MPRRISRPDPRDVSTSKAIRFREFGIKKWLFDSYKTPSFFSIAFHCRDRGFLSFCPLMSVLRTFEETFDTGATVKIVAPGRINLIGEHIDYLDGEVMPVAIDRSIEIAASPAPAGECEIFPDGLGVGSPVRFSTDDLSRRTAPEESWLNYIVGVLHEYQSAGVQLPGFRAVISSTLPIGAGLSSSAALETGIALLVESFSEVEQDVVDRALICQRAEHEYAGVPCGIMDQLAVGAGREGQVLRLDCRNLSFSYYPVPDGVSILAADTGVKHALGDGEYKARREDCEEALRILGEDSFRGMDLGVIERNRDALGDRLYRRSLHAIGEMKRVADFAEALSAGDEEQLGALMKAGHESLRDNYEVSCPELDALVEAAYEFGPDRGLVGSRMTGGGFGGSTVSLVKTDSASNLKTFLEKRYREKFGRALNCFITSAVDGAHAVPVD